MAYLSNLDLMRLGIKKFGINVWISDKASIYGAERITFGDWVRIDDGVVISAGEGGIEIGNYVHLSVGVSIIGAGKVILNDFVGISAKSSVFSSSDDFSGEYLACPQLEQRELTNVINRDIDIGKFVTIGCNSSIFNSIGENSAIGANSLVIKEIPCNSIWAGNPIKFIKMRKKDVYDKEKLIK